MKKAVRWQNDLSTTFRKQMMRENYFSKPHMPLIKLPDFFFDTGTVLK